MGMGFPWESHKNVNTNMPKMGMGMGRVHATMGMGMATFSCVPKFQLVDSMRMQYVTVTVDLELLHATRS